ncbi:MAG TPA: TonB family protein [Pyrinomonadaceae bacterium]|nr:TonB family protein [Pyrinomonadaceae bacterium]
MNASNNPLARAAADGDAKAVQALLAKGADVDGATSGGQTPLILAIISSQTDILRLLLAAGADPQRRDGLGLNAFDWAERRGFADGLALLRQNPSTNQQTQRPATTIKATAPSKSASQPIEPEKLPVTKPPDQSKDAEEKTRRWIAGLRRQFEAEAEHRSKEVDGPPPAEIRKAISRDDTPPVTVTDRRFSTAAKPLEPVVNAPSSDAHPAISTASSEPDLPTVLKEALTADSTTSAVSAPDAVRESPGLTSSVPLAQANRKRCPKCNAVYDGGLVGYCAIDMTRLIDSDQVVVAAAAPQPTATPTLIWFLVVFTFVMATASTYFIIRSLTISEPASTQTTTPAPETASVKSELPSISGDLAGKSLSLPLPEYPTSAKGENVAGTILVRVKVNSKGRVISARSSKGDRRLRQAAIKAAEKATFSAERLSGRAAFGTITYTFKP